MKENDSRVRELCALISVEQDREKFLALVKELNTILSAKEEQQLQEGEPGSPTTH